MVLLDVRLPGMSGSRALPEIHADAPALPLLITAYAAISRQAVAAVKSGRSITWSSRWTWMSWKR